MKDFRTVTLADQVFERLESDIIQGVYPRGEVLTELRLVEQLNVSRTPIREALRRLEQEHLIADTGKGSVVLGITAEDLVDIMDIRCKIEGLASYYAAKNASPEGLARLRHIMDLQEFYFEKRDAEHLREMDDQFHDVICDMGGHAVISDTLVPLHRKTRRYRKASIADAKRTAQVVKEHRAIFDAIAAGDADRAAERAAAHDGWREHAARTTRTDGEGRRNGLCKKDRQQRKTRGLSSQMFRQRLANDWITRTEDLRNEEADNAGDDSPQNDFDPARTVHAAEGPLDRIEAADVEADTKRDDQRQDEIRQQAESVRIGNVRRHREERPPPEETGEDRIGDR